MGMDIHVKVFKYDEEKNHYKELKLFRPGVEYHYDEKGNKVIDNPDFERVTIYHGRNSEMFDGMKDGDDVDGYGYFPWRSVVLNALEETARKELEKKMNTAGYFDFFETNLAEMKAYLLEYPTVIDYDAKNWDELEKMNIMPRKENPISDLFKEICSFCSFADDGWDYLPLSSYKVIFYFDW